MKNDIEKIGFVFHFLLFWIFAIHGLVVKNFTFRLANRLGSRLLFLFLTMGGNRFA